jgi:hypothetical protein
MTTCGSRYKSRPDYSDPGLFEVRNNQRIDYSELCPPRERLCARLSSRITERIARTSTPADDIRSSVTEAANPSCTEGEEGRTRRFRGGS